MTTRLPLQAEAWTIMAVCGSQPLPSGNDHSGLACRPALGPAIKAREHTAPSDVKEAARSSQQRLALHVLAGTGPARAGGQLPTAG
jgi:hypothetical protein